MARTLGGEWWLGLDATEQTAITHVYAATCNAHRWVNVGKGFEEGIKEAFHAIKAAQAGDVATARLCWSACAACLLWPPSPPSRAR